MTSPNKISELHKTVKTELPAGHTKAERIEELKAILSNTPDISNDLANLIGALVNQLDGLDEEAYATLCTINDKSHFCRNTRSAFFDKCKGGELSMARKADLLMTNMSVILATFRPLSVTDAYRLVDILEKANVSPLTMIGAIHAYWIMVLDKEHCINMVKDKSFIIHQLANILRVTTEALVNEIIIEPELALKSAFIKFSKGGSENKICAEYILDTPSQFEFFRRMVIRAAINIATHRRNPEL